MIDEPSILKEFRVTLETVTPLFLGGAETRGIPNPLEAYQRNNRTYYRATNVVGGNPEIRPPALRGALRYWLRALAGESTGGDVKSLHKIESSVFGSAASERGSASTVRVLVREENLQDARLFAKQPIEYVDKNGSRIPQPTGRDYLYWSMAESGGSNRDKYQPPKKYFPEGTSFQVILSAIPFADTALQKAIASLWVMVHFGGVGSRSRRTAGSLSAASPAEFSGLNFQLQSRTPTKIAEELYEGLKNAQQLLALSSKPINTIPFDMISLEYDVFQSWVLGPWDTSAQAVTAIGKSLRNFRTYREPDHSAVFQWLNGSSISTVERSIFGLPIPYKYSTRTKPEGVIQGKKDVIERRASPLWLKISKTGGNTSKFVGVATLFKSAFLPKGEKIVLTGVKNGGRPQPISPPFDFSLIEEWVETMKTDSENFKQVVEVVAND